MYSAQQHDLYTGLLSYVVSENKFYVYNGSTFEKLKVDNDCFLDPVATAADLASIVSPKGVRTYVATRLALIPFDITIGEILPRVVVFCLMLIGYGHIQSSLIERTNTY